MSITLSVFTIGGGDLLEKVFNAVAAAFNNTSTIGAITSLAVMLGGLFAAFEFSKTRDIKVLIKWAGTYVIVTSLILYPKATVAIEDRTGFDIKPRIIDHVPLSLAIFASFTSRIGIGFTEAIETIFHLPDDMAYNKTGMLMGSKLVLASRNFQITDADFSQTLNEFMQQCVFFDLLLKKYSVQDLTHSDNPWEFIKTHTSQARAFPLNGEITICNVGAGKLDTIWRQTINTAASVYGAQILGSSNNPGKLLLSHLSDGYSFLTNVSVQGETLLRTNLLANAMSSALSHYGANSNAPAALQAYEDTKSEMQARETMDQTGRQAAVWMQYFKNIIEAIVYAAFILIYFLSYFPFGGAIVRNYLTGLFVLQALAPMYAIINFAANLFAQNRSIAFLSTDTAHGSLSIANIAGITQANADAMAVAGYLMWPVTLGGAIMLFRGMPGAVQSMGQMMGGVVQHAGSHVVSESVGGNISAGNANFGNRSFNNTNANHWDSNVRYASGGATLQSGTGSSLSITPDGSEVLDNRAAISNLSSNVNWADSKRMVASHQAQSSLNAAFTKSHAAGEQYSTAIRKLDDFSQNQSHSQSSGESHSANETTGLSKSAHTVSQLVDSFAKDHHVSHERAAQVLGQVYADIKGGFSLLGNGVGAGASASASASARSSFGSLYNEAHRFAVDKNLAENVDSAKRAAVESNFRDSSDQGSRLASSIASSFDSGDNYRTEAASQFSKAESYSSMASSSSENASTVYANYNQEFYTWMRHQPSPYGQGTMSKSAIDNMSVHDTPLLQTYANQFVNEKMNGEIKSFDQSHHLTHTESSMKHIYQQNNQSIPNQHHIDNQYEHGKQSVQKEIKHATDNGNGVGSVDQHIRDNVNNRMHENQNQLTQHETAFKQDADPLKNRIHEKVKGQVIGSIDPPKDSLLEKIKHPDSSSILDLYKDHKHE